MRTFVIFVRGWQEVADMNEAIELAKENHTNYIVEVDETKLPDDVTVEDCIYSAENEVITRTFNW